MTVTISITGRMRFGYWGCVVLHIHHAGSSFKQELLGQARRSDLGRVTDYHDSVISWVYINPSRLMLNFSFHILSLRK